MKVSHDVTKVFISFETNASLNGADSAIFQYLLFQWTKDEQTRSNTCSSTVVLLANGWLIHVYRIQSNHYLIMSNSFFIEFKICIPNNRTSKINCSDQYIGLLHFNISTVETILQLYLRYTVLGVLAILNLYAKFVS